MLFNNTSQILSYAAADTGMNGVILPHSNQVLFESDVDSKIKKTKSHIDHLSNAQSHRNTHGGKRFRARQISLRDQIDFSSKRLALLASAKEVIVKSKQSQALIKNFITVSNEASKIFGFKSSPISYTKGPSSYTSSFGGMRNIKVIHANYQ